MQSIRADGIGGVRNERTRKSGSKRGTGSEAHRKENKRIEKEQSPIPNRGIDVQICTIGDFKT